MNAEPLLTIGSFLLQLLISIPSTSLVYPYSRRVVGAPFRWRDFALCTLLMVCNTTINRLLTFAPNGSTIINATFWFFLLVRFVYGQKGWRSFTGLVKVIAMTLVMSLLCYVVLAGLMMLGFDTSPLTAATPAETQTLSYQLTYELINVLAGLLLWLCIALWQAIRRKWKAQPVETQKRSWLYARSISRLVLLMVTAVGMMLMPYSLFGEKTLIHFILDNLQNYIILMACSAALLAVAVSYMIQDIRYIVQLQQLNTLEQQQAISKSLLQNLRFFRHNMVNMLYGLEGVLIDGDRDKVTAYYGEMRDKCALVNNENVAALERLPNPSVNALLLRQVDKARQLNLPINLYVQEKLRFPHVLSDADLCQVLGVLLDNAIEAADKAAERYVTVEMRNVDSALEIIVKNTYAGDITPAQLTQGGQSTKEGHTGQGLLSCYQILSRRRGAFLNFWVTGQYVQAQLLLQK